MSEDQESTTYGQQRLPEEPIATAPELCLYLIMILPDEQARIARVKDFCRLYEIVERRPPYTSAIQDEPKAE